METDYIWTFHGQSYSSNEAFHELIKNHEEIEYITCGDELSFLKASRNEEGNYDLELELDDCPTFFLRNIRREEMIVYMTRFSEGEDFSKIIDSWKIEKTPIYITIIQILIIWPLVIMFGLTIILAAVLLILGAAWIIREIL